MLHRGVGGQGSWGKGVLQLLLPRHPLLLLRGQLLLLLLVLLLLALLLLLLLLLAYTPAIHGPWKKP